MFFIVRCSQIYEQYLKLQILYNNLADLICLNLGNETLDRIEVIARNVLEHLTQEWVSTRDEFVSC